MRPTPQQGARRLTSQVRAALAGIGVAGALLAAVAIRLTPGSAAGTGLASASSRTSPAFWVVHSGQTLGFVSATTGIGLGAIERLNPHADPGALRPGQLIRLRATSARLPLKR